MQQLVLPICFVGLGILLIALEAFVPSAGVLSILAAISLVGAVMAAYYNGGLFVGTAFMLVTGASVSAMIVWMIRIWPNTALGKLVLVEPPPTEELLPDRSRYHSLIGRVGRSTSTMMPGGVVDIEGKRFEAVAEKAIESDTWVEVVSVKNGRILVVRTISEEVALRSSQAEDSEDGITNAPLEEIVPDPFREEA